MKLKFNMVLKISLICICSIVLFLGVALVIYRIVKYQGVADTVRYNTEISNPRLLIATQQSSFKDEVVKKVVDELKKEKINILVTDVTKLGEIKRSDWDAAIIITTVQSGQIQEDSHRFLENNIDNMSHIGVVYTADSGDWKSNDLDIDAISSASNIVNIESVIDRILDKSKSLLELN